MLKKLIFVMMILTILAGCTQNATPTPTIVPSPLPPEPTLAPTATTTTTPTAAPTATTAPTATIIPTTTGIPAAGYGPLNFPAGVDPLTGLAAADPALLKRRPIVIKIENLPREHRPQFGLSLADIIYEYYSEAGGTRFAAVFYGNDAEKVGPIRSARFFDFNVVQMYKGVFAFGYAYADLFSAILNSDFSKRLVLEGTTSSPALFRFEPNGVNLLLANTTAFPAVLQTKKIDNSPQTLTGMFFQQAAPAGGAAGKQVFVRYSGSIYNRWDFDAASGRYLRFADAADDVNRNNEKYTQLTDRLTGKPIAVDNLVMLFVNHSYIKKTADTEVFDMKVIGEGKAFVARDGQLYEVKWKRSKPSDVVTLVNKDGTPFAFKPGQTWVEVLGNNSTLADLKDGAWKFTWLIP